MKLSCKRIDFTYTPGEEIFNFPEESGLPFIFDVEEELTGDPAVMDAVGEMLDEAEKLAEKAKAAIKAALADEDSRYHSVVTFFMEFHRDDVGPDIVAELFPGTDPAKLSFAEMVDFLKLKRFGSLVDSEMNQQVFILDLSFNPEITDELMVIYFDLNKIFCLELICWHDCCDTKQYVDSNMEEYGRDSATVTWKIWICSLHGV